MKKIFLLDGSSLLFRAFFALPLLTAPNGAYTNAIAGFANMLVKLIKERQPDGLAVAFDKSRRTFRTALYADYKGTRAATPEEFKAQVPLLIEMLAAWGIKFIELDDYEADDIIGTLAKRIAAAGDTAYIVTGDRDELQLIGENIRVLYTKRGISDLAAYDVAAFRAEYAGLMPEKLIDIKGLMGDNSDNIPGIAGVGPKTALKLLVEYGSLENVLDHAGEIKGKKLSEKIAAGKETALLSKKLATIVCDAPVSATADELAISPNIGKMQDFCDKYALKSLYKSFAALYADIIAAPAADEAETGDISLFPAETIAEREYPPCPVPAVYDLKALYHRDRAAAEKLRAAGALDVMIAAYVINPNETDFSLETLRAAYEISPGDGNAVEHLGGLLHQKLAASGRLKLYEEIELPLIPVLAEMEETGIYIDRAELLAAAETASSRIAGLTQEIYALAGTEFNINSSIQLADVLFEKLKLTPQKKNKRGYSTNAEVLEELRDEHPIIGKILRYRLWAKLKSTYLDGMVPLIAADGRIHTTFNQTVAATGRLSSSDPNLQNIPVRTDEGREIRRLFKPGAGYDLLLSADYSQIELRILAHLSGDENFLAAFRHGEDIHARTAAEVFGVPLAEVTPEERRRAKAVNFGIVYGISDFGLAKDLGLSRGVAAEYIRKYFATCPKIKEFLDQTIAFARQNGYVETIFGRRRNLPDVHSPNFMRRGMAERMAMNTPIQGTAADIIKLAMTAADRAIKERKLKSRILLQVHDELVLEVTADEAEQVKSIVKAAMENVVKLSVPLPVDVHTGTTWAEAK